MNYVTCYLWTNKNTAKYVLSLNLNSLVAITHGSCDIFIYHKYLYVEFTCVCRIKNVLSLQFCMILFQMNERNAELNVIHFKMAMLINAHFGQQC